MSDYKKEIKDILIVKSQSGVNYERYDRCVGITGQQIVLVSLDADQRVLFNFDYAEAITESYMKLQENQQYQDIAIDRIEFSTCHLQTELTGSDDGTGNQLSQETRLNLFAIVKVRKHL